MALRTALAKRHLTTTTTNSVSRHSLVQTVLSENSEPPNAAKAEFRRQFFTSSDSSAAGFLRRFLQRRTINNHSSPTSLFTLPVGNKLREKLKSLSTAGDHPLTLNWMNPPPPPPPPEEDAEKLVMKIKDAKKMLRFVQMEKVKHRLTNIPANTISYGEFVRICGDVCGSKERGVELSNALDDSGAVIVLGSVVFLRPDQVAKSMEKLISQSIAMPNDPRRNELAQLEKQKSRIDHKAQSLVQRELYCGLGFLTLQTLGFMRLTFWELSWDVMEPICFFVTSAHFALAYAFFLRTSEEPSFSGYFRSRFKVKQKKLMRIYNFDLERYNELCEAFYCK